MKLSDLIQNIWNNMWRRKGRTILTMTGVVIGSVAIFVLVSLGSGFQKFVMSKLGNMSDANTINVIQNDFSNQSDKKKKKILNDNALKELKNLQYVREAVPKYNPIEYSVEYKKNKIPATVVGTSMKEYSKNHELLYGKFPSDSSDECIIEKTMAGYIIDNKNPYNVKDEDVKALINKKMNITVTKVNDDGQEENKVYGVKIVGIFNGGLTDSFSLKLPVNSVRKIEEWKNSNKDVIKSKGYSGIDIVVEDSQKIEDVKKKLKDLGYTYMSFEEITKGFNAVLKGVKMVVGAIGAISLLVAAFGIANTMNMSIYERKKEIGIMKVVGASLLDVKAIFIGEASAIGFMGGLLGITIGILINGAINTIAGSMFAKQGVTGVSNVISIDFGLILFVLVFATAIGLLSGIYPASKAAKLDVISTIKED
ncbi:ABC transporter permease [Clostridium omnivorum]|uniref:ABC transporter permease n=1 Tax=Clostridium omnivorum TaxID=1604902 RepID=A0ABQ5N2H3_9CLOT|nr:FtsX-like permease family protein [Clostridium sp. E14]GLC29381.1 ABC transporter permease [Clostridium sp. E14]